MPITANRNPSIKAAPNSNDARPYLSHRHLLIHCSYGETQKLNETNYHQWRIAIEAFPLVENALKIVHRTENRPVGASAAQVQAAGRYATRLGKAYALIFSSCSQTAQVFFTGLEHPADMWDTLKQKMDIGNLQADIMLPTKDWH